LDLGYSLQVIDFHAQGGLIPPPLSSSSVWPSPTAKLLMVPPHFSPVFFLAVPFYKIGGVWGVLIFQVLCFGVAAIGVFLYAWVRVREAWAATLTHLHFWGMWGITSALGFDFHEIVVGIMGLPFVWLGLELRRYWLAFVGWAIFIGGKENLALWGIWMALGLCFFYKDAERRKRLLGMSLAAALWFVIGHALFGKHTEGVPVSASRTEHLYGYLAASDPVAAVNGRVPVPEFSYVRILRTFLNRPQLIWSLLFESPFDDGQYRFIKSELYWALLGSGGWSFFFVPLYLILAFPAVLYKVLSAGPAQWGTLAQYSVEFVPLLPLAVLHATERWKEKRRLFWFGLAAGAIGAHSINFAMMNHPYSIWFVEENNVWFSWKHYSPVYSYSCVHEGLALIPREASVAASSRLLPHIPARARYYIWPAGGAQADYIALLREDPNPWPATAQEVAKDISALERSRAWEKIWDKCGLVIFRRRPQR
ncbi:MAG: DUF2079 domain-containing protein, partial [Bacteroidetes bacterium]